MRKLRTRSILCIGALHWALSSAAMDPAIARVEVTSNPESRGHQIFTIGITPTETRAYEMLRIDCTYRQEFIQQTSRGPQSRAIEPAAFTYRRRDVRMVADLDHHVSFRVPVSMEEIQKMHTGRYRLDAPIWVSRIRITAVQNGEDVWSIEVPATGIHVPPFRSSIR